MIEFKAIQILSIVPINKRLRLLTDKINELEARLDALNGSQGESVADEATQTIVEPVDVAQPEEATLIEDELRQKAKGLGVTNWHNKKLENIINEIAEIEAGD